MRVKSERDFCSGLVFVVVGVGFAVGATHYGMGPACPPQEPCAADLWARFAQISTQPGPGFLPLGLGVLLAFVGAVVLFKSLTIESEGGDPIGAFAWRPLVAVTAAIAGFAALLEPLGLVVSTAVLVCIASRAGAELQWKSMLACAAALTLAAWLVLGWALQLAVPMWPEFLR